MHKKERARTLKDVKKKKVSRYFCQILLNTFLPYVLLYIHIEIGFNGVRIAESNLIQYAK